MSNRSWGIELWDQFENVSKYTDKSLQFCEKYESFLKDRSTVEDDYAKALKKLTKTYTPKVKEQEEFYNKYSFTFAFCSSLKELQDLASQHELIAENLRERAIKQIQITVKECREQRKKYLDEYTRFKRQLDKQHELMMKSLRKYEECHESARRAKESYEKAHEDLDLSRAQLEKARDTMTTKSKICDDSRASYSSYVSLFNDAQHLFYERQLPTILNDLQQLDCRRSDELKDVYMKCIHTHAEVLPRIQCCLDEMTKQTEQINANHDTNVVIEEYKSGYQIPNDEKEIDLNAGDLPSLLMNGSHLQNNHNDQQIYNINYMNPNELARSNTLRSSGSDHSCQNGLGAIYAVGNASGHVNGTQTLMATPSLNSRKTNGSKSGGTASTIRKIFGSSSQRKSIFPSNNSNGNAVSVNTPYSSLPPAQRLKKFQEQIQNCRNELEKQQKAKEGLTKMKLVFQENPKFGDEQDVIQQIRAIDEHIDKLQAEIKRFEAYIAEIDRSRAPVSVDYDSTSYLRAAYGSDQSISNTSQPSTPSQNRSPPDVPTHANDSTRQISAYSDQNGSFEDEEIDNEPCQPVDQMDSHYSIQSNEGIVGKASALYDFNGQGTNGCQYVNAVTISAGECIDILEDDQGDGWTRIQKPDGSIGFVPSTYLRIESSTSQKTDSGRF